MAIAREMLQALVVASVAFVTSAVADESVFGSRMHANGDGLESCASSGAFKQCVSAGPKNTDTRLAPVDGAWAAQTFAAQHSAGLGLLIKLVEESTSTNAKKLEELKSTVADLTKEIKQQNEVMRVGLRSEILARIDRLPIDLAKDDEAYKLLKARLVGDLSEIFAAR